MPDPTVDPELHAMQQVLTSLESLDADGRARVLAYVYQRLGMNAPTPAIPPAPPAAAAFASPAAATAGSASLPMTDIRSLKDAKQPKSDNQMAALVAYYLKELAPPADRKDVISHEDIEKYFKQAGFPLPKLIRMPLNNAKNAGYFDSVGSGLFRLNPVGHNLVAHGMSLSAQSAGARSRTAKKGK